MERNEFMQKIQEAGRAVDQLEATMEVVKDKKVRGKCTTVFGKTFNSADLSEAIGKEKSYISYTRKFCKDPEYFRLCIITKMREIGLDKFGITEDNEPKIVAYFPLKKKGPVIKINNKWMPLRYWNKEIGRNSEYLSKYIKSHSLEETRNFIIKCLKEKDPNFRIKVNVEFDEKSGHFIVDGEKYTLRDISVKLLNKSEGYLSNHKHRYFNDAENNEGFIKHITEELEAKYNNDIEHQTSLFDKDNNVIENKTEDKKEKVKKNTKDNDKDVVLFSNDDVTLIIKDGYVYTTIKSKVDDYLNTIKNAYLFSMNFAMTNNINLNKK